MCKDYKMIPSEYLGTQHRLLVIDVVIKRLNIMKRIAEEPTIRWWNLTREKATNLSEKIKAKGGPEASRGCKYNVDGMAECIQRSAKEVLGISKGGGGKMKGA